MSNLMTQEAVTGNQAITALMAGGLVMIPVTRLRRTPGIWIFSVPVTGLTSA